MTVEERQRAEALQRLTEEIGVDATRALIHRLPPPDVATRAEMHEALADHRAETRADLAEHRAETRADLAEHRAETTHQLERLRAELITAFETGIRQAVTTQTRTLVLSQLGALVALTAVVLGLG